VETIPVEIILKSDLITAEERHGLVEKLARHPRIAAGEILELDLPAKNRVEALLQPEFLNEGRLRDLACDFAAHTLHVFESYAPSDYRPHECLSAAFLLNTWSIGSWEQLRETIRKAQPVLRQFEGTEHSGAFEACRAALLMARKDAARMTRKVAICAQLAAHRNAWENRRSNTESMIARETEAAWQLRQIAGRLS
jgi:hypothetical protein